MACHGTLLKVDVGGSVYAVLADTRVPQRTNPYEDSGLNPILQLVNFVLACHRPDASCSPSSIVMDQDMHAFGRGDPLLFIRKPDLRLTGFPSKGGLLRLWSDLVQSRANLTTMY